MKNQKPGDRLSQLGRILRQPRYAALAFGAVSLVVVGAGVAVKNFSSGDAPLNMGGFSEGPTTTLERPAETQLSSGLDSTDMATFGEKPAQGARGSGGNTPVAPDSQDKAEKTETPLSEFPTGADPRKLNLKGQDQGGGGSSGAASAAPSLGGPFERMSSLAGRAFNNSQAFFRSLGGKTRQAGAPKNQGGAAPQTQSSADKTAVNTGAKTGVGAGGRTNVVGNSAGSPINIGGTPIGGTGAGLGEGPKESKGSGGQGGGGGSGGGGGTTTSTSTTTANGPVDTSTGTMVLALEALNNAFDKLNKECGTWKTPVSETCLKLQVETIAADKEVDGLFGQASSNMKLLIGEIEKSCGSGFWMGGAKNPAESAKNCNSAIEAALEAAKKEELEKLLEKNSEVVDNDAGDLRQALEDLNKAFDALSKECGKDKWDKNPSEKCEKLRAEAEAAGKRVDELFSGASASGQDLIKKMWASCGTGFWMGGAKNPAESAKNCNNAIEAALAAVEKEVDKEEKDGTETADDDGSGSEGDKDKETETTKTGPEDEDDPKADDIRAALDDLNNAFDRLNKECGKSWSKNPSKDCEKLRAEAAAAGKRLNALSAQASADVQSLIKEMQKSCGDGFWMGGAKDPAQSATNCNKAIEAALAGKASNEENVGNTGNPKKDAEAVRDELQREVTRACYGSGGRGAANPSNSKECQDARAKLVEMQANVEDAIRQERTDELAAIDVIREKEKIRDQKQADVYRACGGGGYSQRTKGDPNSQSCKDAKEILKKAQEEVDVAKKARPSGCENSWLPALTCTLAEIEARVAPKNEAKKEQSSDSEKDDASPIQSVMAAEKELEAAQKAKAAACAAKGGRGNQKVSNPEACQKAKEDVVAAQKKVDDVKKEKYGCKNIIETFVECSRITIDGAAAIVLGTADKKIKTENQDKETTVKDNKAEAEKAISEGRYTDCYKTVILGAKGRELQYKCKEKGKTGEVVVTNAVFAAFTKDQKNNKKDDKTVTEQKDETASSKNEGISKVWKISDSLALANEITTELKDKKWSQRDICPACPGYDKSLSIQYEERQRLAKALRDNRGKNPAEVYTSLWNSGQITHKIDKMDELVKKFDNKELQLQSYSQQGNTSSGGVNSSVSTVKPKAPTQTLSQETQRTGSGQKDKFNVVTPEGKSQGMMVIECDPSKGMLRIGNACQLVGSTKDLPVAIYVGSNKSPSGWKFAESCGKNETFKVTNTPLMGRGKCEPKTGAGTSTASTTNANRNFYDKYDPNKMRGKKCSVGTFQGKDGWWCQ